MIGLNRSLAPVSARAWQRIEAEARDVLDVCLAARKLVDFEGPLGWEHSAVDLGRVEVLEGERGGDGVIRKRVVRPLVEIRVPFDLDRAALEEIDRGGVGVDLDPVRDAAREFAELEDRAIFEGYAAAEIPALLTDSEDAGLLMPKSGESFPNTLSEALGKLRQAGVSGPYALALGPEGHELVERAAPSGGYPLAKHVARLIDGPIIWAPTLRGGLVLSMRGGDFRIVCGRDASLGYIAHDERSVRLYLEESFTFILDGPEAVIPLLAEVHE